MNRKNFVKSIIIGIILVTIWNLFSVFAVALYGWDLWYMTPIYGPLVFISLYALLTSYLRVPRLNIDELIIVYSMFLVSSGTGLLIANWIPVLAYTAFMDVMKQVRELIPDLWVPRDLEVLRGAFYGGEVPWNAWLPTLAYWITFIITICLNQLLFAYILRKEIVEVKSLPFPIGEAAVSVINISYEKNKSKKLSYLTLGFALSLVYYLPSLISAIYPQFAVPRYWFLEWDGTTLSLPNAAIHMNLNPTWIAFCFMLPLDLLITSSLTYLLLFIVLPPILVWTGLQAYHPEQFDFGNYVWVGFWAPEGPNFPSVMGWGGLLGLGISVIVFNYRHIAETFKKALGKIKNHEEPYGILWVSWIITFILFISFLLQSGVFLHVAIFFSIFAFLLYIGFMSMRSEGYWTSAWYHASEQFLYLLHGELLFTRSNLASSLLGTIMFMDAGSTCSPLQLSMESFVVSNKFNVDHKKVFVSQIVSILIGIIASVVIVTWALYLLGYYKSWRFTHNPQWYNSIALAAVTLGTSISFSPRYDLWLPWYIFGVMLSIMVTALRTFYAWFPFTAVGIVVGTQFGMGYELWLPSLIAYFLKRITVRVGGAHMYENKALPLAIGMFSGRSLMELIITFAKGLII